MTLNVHHNFERFFYLSMNALIILKTFFYILKSYFIKKVLTLNARHKFRLTSENGLSFIFRKYYRKSILRAAYSKYFRNI